MRLHTGSKPFKCPHCDLHFRTSGHRKSHVKQHANRGWDVSMVPGDENDTSDGALLNTVSDIMTQIDAAATVVPGGTGDVADGGNTVINIEPSTQQLLPFSFSLSDVIGNAVDGDIAVQVREDLEDFSIFFGRG